ncbi:MAG TPA: anti-sigma factor antagonist [Streptosporangiaceae bacterium]|jgi:anti-anti-sigma factor
MDTLRISSRRIDDVVVVAAGGDLDIVTSPQLDATLTEARRGSAAVVLDLSAADFMDTSSLAVIVGHWKKLSARGGILALAGARYRYTKTLWITGLADRLPMFDSVAEAVAACSGRTAADGARPERADGEPGSVGPGR